MAATQLGVRLPNGQLVAITHTTKLGRGNPPDLTDPALSREQILLTPVEGIEGVLKLEALGRNPLVVEVPDKGDHPQQHEWHVKDFLDQGASTIVSAGARFYLAARQESTMFTIEHWTDTDATAELLQLGGPATSTIPTAAATSVAAEAATPPSEQTMPLSRNGDDSEASILLTPGGRPAKRARLNAGARSPATTATGSAASNGATATDAAAAGSGDDQTAAQGCPFALLRVRGIASTYNTGCFGARLRDIITGDIQLAFIENYMIDLGWLLSACPALHTAKQVIVVHGEHGNHEADIQATARSCNLGHESFICHRPPLPIQWGTHHSKAFILVYASGIRVVIHTANLIYVDCNNKTQGVWYQDFPAKGPGAAAITPFESDLADYLSALKLPSATSRQLQQIVARHDFSSARVQLLASVPGYHSGALKLHAYGHMRLRALLSAEDIAPEFRAAHTIMQCSSLGSLDDKWLMQEFLSSCTAGNYAAQSAAAVPSTTNEKDSSSRTASRQPGLHAWLTPSTSQPGPGCPSVCAGPTKGVPVSIIWPTVQEVRDSLEGWIAGYSIPGPEKNVGKPFLKPYWCR
eukprot:jgi/Chrzof1/10095/Cz04g26260.t1